MVVGGVASTVYGEPRLTQGIDVVASFTPMEAGRLVAQFPDMTDIERALEALS